MDDIIRPKQPGQQSGLLGGIGGNTDEQDLTGQYTAWLETLQRTDPDAYAKLIEELMAAESEGQGAGQASPSMEEYEKALSQLDQMQKQNSQEFAPRMPGSDNIMGPGGIKKQEEGIEVIPDAGFVIKTKTLGEGRKIFINVCQSLKLQEPATKKKLDNEGKEQEGINIPLSLGPPIHDKDKSGTECTVYDIVVNPKVIDDAKADETGNYRNFLCELSLQYVEQKYKAPLDHQFKLPKLKYKGEAPRPQYIRKAAAAPVIEEVTESQATKPAKKEPKLPNIFIKHKITCTDGPGLPDYPLKQEPAVDGGPLLKSKSEEQFFPHEIIVSADLSERHPPLEKIEMEVSAQLLLIRAPGYHTLELYLPYPVHDSDVKATLACEVGRIDAHVEKHELVVILVVDTDYIDRTGPDIGSTPWLLNEALDSGDDRQSNSQGTKDSLDAAAAVGTEAEDSDKFHLKRSAFAGTGSASGGEPRKSHGILSSGEIDDEILPEDKFHKKDVISQQMIETRERERREKIDRADAERKERAQKAGRSGDAADEPICTVEEMSLDDKGEPVTKVTETIMRSELTGPQMIEQIIPKEVEVGQSDTSKLAAEVAEKTFGTKMQKGPGLKLNSNLAFQLLD